MNEPKQTFTDPATGEEIKSTAEARWVAELAFRMIRGLALGLVLVLFSREVWGLFFGLFLGLAANLDLDKMRSNSFYQRVHDHIARWQHFRHQRVRQQKRLRAERLLQRKRLEAEWAGVPDGALSRTRRTANPEPSEKSLSQTHVPQEEAAPHLTEGVEPASEAEGQAISPQPE